MNSFVLSIIKLRLDLVLVMYEVKIQEKDSVLLQFRPAPRKNYQNYHLR